MCVCVCAYTCVRACGYIYGPCVYECVCVCVCVLMCLCMCACVHVCVCVYLYLFLPPGYIGSNTWSICVCMQPGLVLSE